MALPDWKYWNLIEFTERQTDVRTDRQLDMSAYIYIIMQYGQLVTL